MMQQTLSILTKVQSLIHTLFGWALLALTSFWAFIKPEIYTFAIVGIVIIFDLIFGIAVAKRQKKFILSESMRSTCIKIVIYAAMLLLVHAIERVLHDDHLIATRLACVLAASCELWSISANMLILKPDLPFLKLFRLHLKGEIEKKTGVNTNKVFEDGNNE